MSFEFAVVGVRLMGVWLIVGLGMPALMAVGTIFQVMQTPYAARMLPPMLWMFMPIIVGAVIIAYSRAIGGWITPANVAGVKASQPAVTEMGLLTAGTMLIALWLAAMAVVDLVGVLFGGAGVGVLGAVTGRSIWTVLAQFGVAGGLFVLARK